MGYTLQIGLDQWMYTLHLGNVYKVDEMAVDQVGEARSEFTTPLCHSKPE